VRSVVEQILNQARWAPSGDNTQPWRFEIVDDSHVLVHGFDTRETCVYDLDGFASQIAHGALLETLRIAATEFGLRAEAARQQAAPETRPVFEIRLYPDDRIAPDPLIRFIERRCTQRRHFRVAPLGREEKEALVASVGNSYTLFLTEGWAGRWFMARLLFSSAWIRLTIPEAYEVHRSIIQWGARASEDRIPDAAIGLDPLALRLMHWAMGSWERVTFLNRYFAGHVLPRIELDLWPALRCAAHFILLRNTEPRGIDDVVDAGRALQRLWLTASKLGLQFQPEMTPLIFARYHNRGISFTRVRSALSRAEKVASMLAHVLGEPPARAVFMGRIGYGTAPSARSTRLPLDRLLESATSREGM
jgi:hypothetical protein